MKQHTVHNNKRRVTCMYQNQFLKVKANPSYRLFYPLYNHSFFKMIPLHVSDIVHFKLFNTKLLKRIIINNPNEGEHRETLHK